MPAEDIIAALRVTGQSTFSASMAGAKSDVSGLQGATESMGETAGKAGGKMGTFAGMAGKAKAGAIGFAAVAAGWALKSGAQYNAQLDQARLKFGLFTKSAKETQQVIEGVNKVATASTFSRPELSAVAAQLGFAGVKAKDLGHDVLGVANAATAVGGTSGDLKHISDILSKMAIGGKANLGDIQQLAQAGLPVYDVLHKKLGMTNDQIQKIGYSGTSTKKLYKALMDTFTSGQMASAAAKQADSTAGRWHNIIARIKREAGDMMRPIWDTLGTKVFPAIQAGIKPAFSWLESQTHNVGQDIQKGFSMPPQALAGYGGVTKAIMDIGHAFRVVFDLFTKGAGADILNKAFADLKPILDFIVLDFKVLWQVVVALWPVIKLLAEVIGGALYVALLLVGPLFKGVGWVMQNVFGPAVVFVANLLGRLANAIQGGVRAAINWFKGAAGSVAGAWQAVVGFFGGLPGKISGALSSVVGKVRSIFNSAKDAVVGVLKSIPGAVVGIGKGIIDAIVSGIKSAPGAIASAIKSMIPGPLLKVASKVPGLSSLVGATGRVMAAATGATTGAGRNVLVGENGPEIATLPSGARITPLPPPMLSPSQLMGGGNKPIVTQVFLEKRQIAEAVGSYAADQQASR